MTEDNQQFDPLGIAHPSVKAEEHERTATATRDFNPPTGGTPSALDWSNIADWDIDTKGLKKMRMMGNFLNPDIGRTLNQNKGMTMWGSLLNSMVASTGRGGAAGKAVGGESWPTDWRTRLNSTWEGAYLLNAFLEPQFEQYKWGDDGEALKGKIAEKFIRERFGASVKASNEQRDIYTYLLNNDAKFKGMHDRWAAHVARGENFDMVAKQRQAIVRYLQTIQSDGGLGDKLSAEKHKAKFGVDAPGQAKSWMWGEGEELLNFQESRFLDRSPHLTMTMPMGAIRHLLTPPSGDFLQHFTQQEAQWGLMGEDMSGNFNAFISQQKAFATNEKDKDAVSSIWQSRIALWEIYKGLGKSNASNNREFDNLVQAGEIIQGLSHALGLTPYSQSGNVSFKDRPWKSYKDLDNTFKTPPPIIGTTSRVDSQERTAIYDKAIEQSMGHIIDDLALRYSTNPGLARGVQNKMSKAFGLYVYNELIGAGEDTFDMNAIAEKGQEFKELFFSGAIEATLNGNKHLIKKSELGEHSALESKDVIKNLNDFSEIWDSGSLVDKGVSFLSIITQRQPSSKHLDYMMGGGWAPLGGSKHPLDDVNWRTSRIPDLAKLPDFGGNKIGDIFLRIPKTIHGKPIDNDRKLALIRYYADHMDEMIVHYLMPDESLQHTFLTVNDYSRNPQMNQVLSDIISPGEGFTEMEKLQKDFAKTQKKYNELHSTGNLDRTTHSKILRRKKALQHVVNSVSLRDRTILRPAGDDNYTFFLDKKDSKFANIPSSLGRINPETGLKETMTFSTKRIMEIMELRKGYRNYLRSEMAKIKAVESKDWQSGLR